MAINVGELQATLGINTKGFSSGIKSAQGDINSLASTMSVNVKQSSDAASSSMKSAGKSAKEYASQMKTAGNDADAAAKQIESAGEEIKKSGEKADSAEKLVGKFKTVMSMIGVTISVGTVIAKIKELIEKLREAYDLSERAAASFERTLGTTKTGNVEQYKDYVDELITTTTYDEGSISAVLSKVIKTTPDSTDPEVIKNLTKEYLALGTMGFGGLTSNVDDAYVVFEKWGVSADQQAEKLALFMDICRNTNIDMTTLLQSLKNFDFLGSAMGMTIDEMATAIGNAGANIDDLGTVETKFETYYYQLRETVAENLGEGADTEAIDNGVKEILKEAIDTAKELPESERVAFWSNLLGEPVGMSTTGFSKGMSTLLTGGKTFSSDTSAYDLYMSTLTTSEKSQIAHNTYWYEMGQQFGGAWNDMISQSSDQVLADYERIKQIEQGTITDAINDATEPQVIVNNTVTIESSDPYTRVSIAQTDAVSAMNNPAISS